MHPRDRFRLLALDVDGTILDGRGALRPRTASAIARAAEAGIRPVLCTGRRYRRALPLARELGLEGPIVCNSGAILKETAGHRTLWRADFDPGLRGDLLRAFAARDEPIVGFSDLGPDEADFVVASDPTGRDLFDDYLSQNRPHARVDPAWADRGDPHFHLCAIGDRPRMLALEAELLGQFPGRIRTFVQRSPSYSGTMCEVLRHDASKWAAITRLMDAWGIAPEQVVAVGDDMNDLPMILGAGLGVAMAHAPRAVLDAGRSRHALQRQRPGRGGGPDRRRPPRAIPISNPRSPRSPMSEPSWTPRGRTPRDSWKRTGCSACGRSGSGRGLSGKEHDFFVLDLADAVNVIAVTPDRRRRPGPAVPRGVELRQPGAARRPPRTRRGPRGSAGARELMRGDRLRRRRRAGRPRVGVVEPVDPVLENHDHPDPQRRALGDDAVG